MSATDPRPDLIRPTGRDYYSTELAPTRDQHRYIAALAAQLLGVKYQNRYDATLFEARLRAALEDVAAGGEAPTLKEEAW